MKPAGKSGSARTASDNVRRRKWRPIQAYAFAVSSVLLAFLLRYYLMGVLDDRAIYILFVPPVLLAAVTGGIGPGAVALFLSICSAAYLRSLTPGGVQVPELTVFVAVGIAIAFMGELRAAVQKSATVAAE